MSFTTADWKAIIRGALGFVDATPEEIKAVVDGGFAQNQPLHFDIPLDADGDFTVLYRFTADKDITITGVTFLTAGTVTGHGTNYTTIAMDKYDGAGGAGTVVASRATDTPTTDDIAAGVPWALTLSVVAGAVDVDAGEVLGFLGTKASAGVAWPAGTFTVTYVPR